MLKCIPQFGVNEIVSPEGARVKDFSVVVEGGTSVEVDAEAADEADEAAETGAPVEAGTAVVAGTAVEARAAVKASSGTAVDAEAADEVSRALKPKRLMIWQGIDANRGDMKSGDMKHREAVVRMKSNEAVYVSDQNN